MSLVEVFGCDPCRYFVYDWNTVKAQTATVKQVHDVATCNEEAVSVTLFNE